MSRQLPKADVLEELSITLSPLIFSTPCGIAGNLSEISLSSASVPFPNKYECSDFFKLLTLEGECF